MVEDDICLFYIFEEYFELEMLSRKVESKLQNVFHVERFLVPNFEKTFVGFPLKLNGFLITNLYTCSKNSFKLLNSLKSKEVKNQHNIGIF